MRNRETLGSPLTLCIYNRDYENCARICRTARATFPRAPVTKVRPGHADLAGVIKFAQNDARNILERASARETAIRVAAGSVFKQYLSALGVEIGGYVKEVCGVKDEGRYAFSELSRAKESGLGMLDAAAEKEAEEKVASLKTAGDTAGGVAEIRVKGLKSGFGSCMTYAEKLDARLAAGLMSIQAVKGVEVGAGFASGGLSGREVHDEIFYENGFRRATNRAGGIEGGMSNGEEIVLRAAMKPIPTLMRGTWHRRLSHARKGDGGFRTQRRVRRFRPRSHRRGGRRGNPRKDDRRTLGRGYRVRGRRKIPGFAVTTEGRRGNMRDGRRRKRDASYGNGSALKGILGRAIRLEVYGKGVGKERRFLRSSRPFSGGKGRGSDGKDIRRVRNEGRFFP